MAKKYSIIEIDQMRRAVQRSYPTGVSYMATERNADVENRLRTYMQNGTTVKELQEGFTPQQPIPPRSCP